MRQGANKFWMGGLRVAQASLNAQSASRSVDKTGLMQAGLGPLTVGESGSQRSLLHGAPVISVGLIEEIEDGPDENTMPARATSQMRVSGLNPSPPPAPNSLLNIVLHHGRGISGEVHHDAQIRSGFVPGMHRAPQAPHARNESSGRTFDHIPERRPTSELDLRR